MKKIAIFLSIIAVLVSGIVSVSAQMVTAADKTLDIAICGGSIGGAWAAIGEGVCEVVRRSYPGSNAAYEVGQEAANLMLVANGKVQLGVGHAQLIKMASNGVEPFDKKVENLRALCVLYHGALQHYIVRTDAGVPSIEELKAKKHPLKIYFNTKNSFMDIVARKGLEAEGVTVDDIKAWGGLTDNSSMGAALDLMRDNRIEAYSNIIQVPSSHVVDAGTTLGLQLWSLSKQAQDKVNAELGTYSAVIPANSYNFQKEDVPTVGASVILFTNADLPDDDAYAILQSIKDNFEYFTNIHGSLKGLKIGDLKETAPVPLHPGAEKFFNDNK